MRAPESLYMLPRIPESASYSKMIVWNFAEMYFISTLSLQHRLDRHADQYQWLIKAGGDIPRYGVVWWSMVFLLLKCETNPHPLCSASWTVLHAPYLHRFSPHCIKEELFGIITKERIKIPATSSLLLRVTWTLESGTLKEMFLFKTDRTVWDSSVTLLSTISSAMKTFSATTLDISTCYCFVFLPNSVQ